MSNPQEEQEELTPMEALLGPTLMQDPQGKVTKSTKQVLASKTLVMLYFSARWEGEALEHDASTCVGSHFLRCLLVLFACLVLFLINDTKQLVSGKFLVCCSFSSLESFATQLTFAWTTFSRSLPFFVLSQRHHTCIHAMIALSNLVTQTQGILSTCARFSRNNLH